MKTIGTCIPDVKRGFTLIELLVVIAIIAILAGLLTPAISSALGKAKYTQARTEVMSIASAIKAYNNEYGKLPAYPASASPSPKQNDNDDSVAIYTSNLSVNVIRVLGDSDNTTGLNPRRIVFLESKSTDGSFVDPWKMQYLVKLDTDYNNSMTYTNAQKIKTVAIVVSYGSDQKLGGTGKDVLSFE